MRTELDIETIEDAIADHVKWELEHSSVAHTITCMSYWKENLDGVLLDWWVNGIDYADHDEVENTVNSLFDGVTAELNCHIQAFELTDPEMIAGYERMTAHWQQSEGAVG